MLVLIGRSDQYDARMIVAVVSLYDTYLRGLFVRLTTPLCLVRWEPLCVLVPLVPRMELLGYYINNILFFYTRLICVQVEPAQPTPSTAPPLPCETHPAQRPSITLVGNPTQGTPLITSCCYRNVSSVQTSIL